MTVPWYFTVLAYILCGAACVKITALVCGKDFFYDTCGDFSAGYTMFYLLLWPLSVFTGLFRVLSALLKLLVGCRPKPPELTPEERRLLKDEGIDP
jgi:hypothetical protein